MRGATHVLLHEAHVGGRLEVQPAAVEAHALADQGDLLILPGRPSAGRSGAARTRSPGPPRGWFGSPRGSRASPVVTSMSAPWSIASLRAALSRSWGNMSDAGVLIRSRHRPTAASSSPTEAILAALQGGGRARVWLVGSWRIGSRQVPSRGPVRTRHRRPRREGGSRLRATSAPVGRSSPTSLRSPTPATTLPGKPSVPGRRTTWFDVASKSARGQPVAHRCWAANRAKLRGRRSRDRLEVDRVASVVDDDDHGLSRARDLAREFVGPVAGAHQRSARDIDESGLERPFPVGVEFVGADPAGHRQVVAGRLKVLA